MAAASFMIVTGLVFPSLSQSSSSPDELESSQSLGFFQLLPDDYGGSQTHFHCGIDPEQVGPEEFKRIYPILLDYAMSAELEVGVEYPVTPGLLEMARAKVKEQALGASESRGDFDEPDRKTIDDYHAGSAADSDSGSGGACNGWGYGDVYD